MLGLLTLGLVGFVLWGMHARSVAPVSSTGKGDPTVNEDTYRADTKAVVRDYRAAYAKAGTDLERLLVTEKAIDALLALRVPADEKDFHLDLVVSLNLIRNGLRGEEGSLAQGQARFERLLATTPWLQ